MFSFKPPAEFHHPRFGKFECEDGLWIAAVQQGSHFIELAVSGSGVAPDEHLLTSASRVLAKFDELRALGLAYLTAGESLAASKDFTTLGLIFYRADHSDDFTFTFAMTGDADSIWRVEFVSGVPRFTGRDD